MKYLATYTLMIEVLVLAMLAEHLGMSGWMMLLLYVSCRIVIEIGGRRNNDNNK